MNELSAEVKAKEIHENAASYYNVSQEYGYKFLMEVKKIRDERLFEHLGFSTFVSYCLSSWGYEHDYMNERIRMADEFKEEYDGYSRSLGHKKTLLLARMPEPQREQATTEGIPTEQGYKTYDEATQKEIAEWKRNSKEAERKAEEYQKQLEQAQRSQDILQNKLDEAENKEPERIEVEKEVIKEVIPEDYENMKNALEDFRKKFSRESRSAENLREELKKYTEAFSDPSQAYEESQVKRLERESSINAYKLSVGIQKFIEDNAVETYKISSVIKANENAKKRLEENIDLLEDFTTNVKALLNGRIITN